MLPWQPSRSTSDVKVGAERERERSHGGCLSGWEGRAGASEPPGAIMGALNENMGRVLHQRGLTPTSSFGEQKTKTLYSTFIRTRS